jgi:hypothetical protein
MEVLNKLFVLFHVYRQQRQKILKFMLLYYFYEQKDKKEISFVCKSICLEIICRIVLRIY